MLDDFSSPAVSLITFLTAIQIAVGDCWSFATFDIESAFLNAVLPLDPPVYMRLPDGHSHRERGFVARLRKAIYGMKEAGRLFFNMFEKILLSFDLAQSKYDPCFFYGTDIFVLVYVDDCLLLGEPVAVHTKLYEDVDFL